MPRPSINSRFLSASAPNVGVMGRADRTSSGRLRLGYPGVTLRLAFTGSRVSLHSNCSSPNCRLAVIVDGGPPSIVRLPQADSEVALVQGLAAGEHQLEIIRRTEFWQGVLNVVGFGMDPNAELLPHTPWPPRKLLFIGDSVTSGEGVDRPQDTTCPDKSVSSDAYNSYGMVLGRALGAQCHLISFGGRGLIRDYQGDRDLLTAPQFFELTLPTLQPRVVWDHMLYVPDGIFISLGTNDFNPAIGEFPSEREFVGAYLAFLRRLRTLYPSARILLTEGAIVTDAKRPQKSTLRHFIEATRLEMRDPNILAIPSNCYPGDAFDNHPTGKQHRQMAADFAPLLRQFLGW